MKPKPQDLDPFMCDDISNDLKNINSGGGFEFGMNI